MHYLHIKNLEEYNPGYQDRNLIWCKAYFKMINSDQEFEMLCEIDKWRFMAFVMLELQIKNPIILNEDYLNRKGFDFKKRSLKETIKSLGKSIELFNDLMKPIEINDVTDEIKERNAGVTQSRVDKTREDKKRVDSSFDFESLWINYPSKVGKNQAFKFFNSTVRSEKDYEDIKSALENYIKSERVIKGFIQNGSTWFNNWRDWIVSPIQNIYKDADGIPKEWRTGAGK